MGSVSIEIVNLLWAAGGIAFGYIGSRIASGNPPTSLRDAFAGVVRAELTAFFPSGVTQLPPPPPPQK